MQFCRLCGKEVASYQKFCKYCGAPVGDLPPPPSPPAPPFPLSPSIPPVEDPEPPQFPAMGDSPKPPGIPKNTFIIAAAVVIIIVIASMYFVVVPRVSGTMGQGTGPSASPTQVPEATTAPVMTTVPTATTVPTPTPNPFPDAHALGTWINFSSDKTAGQGTVYKKWMNDTYQWHNDNDNQWYPQKARAGNKYLLVFVCMVNRGDTRVWYPKAKSIIVHYNNQVFSADPSHYIPDKSGGNVKATPVEIREVQFYPKVFGAEYVEDFGLSHGTMLDFVYPGESNAVDGYIIYEVPSSLTADTSYVEIVFNSEDHAVWKLA
jgi:hypothetical protein